MTKPKFTYKKEETLTELTIEIPTHISTGSKKKYGLNLNVWNTIHYRTKHKIKQLVFDLLKDKLKPVKLLEPFNVEFTLQSGDKGKKDKSNFFSVGSKIVYDALTCYSVISDDNDSIIRTETIYPSTYVKNEQKMIFTFKSIL
jgi:hypothetical protein